MREKVNKTNSKSKTLNNCALETQNELMMT